MDKAAVVLGNGVSRRQFDLNKIHAIATTYGCNAIHRDFAPHYLVAMDWNMVDEIIQARAFERSKFYTQHEGKTDALVERDRLPIYFVSNQPETVDSGNSAVRLAAENRHPTIYLVGFDYMQGQTLSNVYTGTRNYNGSQYYASNHMMYTKWRQRMSKILRAFPNQQFVRVNALGDSYSYAVPNFIDITAEQFMERINENRL